MANIPKLEDFLNKEIPPEIFKQLEILGRVQFPLKQTHPSAVSSSAQVVPQEEKDEEESIDDLINHVKSMEDLTEQLEDMIDELTKDMNISPANDSIGAAASRLNPDGSSNITKDTLNRALAVMDHLPHMVGLGDPILGALTGDANVNGPWIKCNQITQALSDTFSAAAKKDYDPNTPIPSQANQTAEEYNKKQQNMLIELLNMLWWNMIWAKYLIDPVLINPLKMLVSPIDAIILIFQFTSPSTENIEKKGPLTKFVKKLRIFLLCIPKIVYSNYQSPPDVDCTKILVDCSKTNSMVGDKLNPEPNDAQKVKATFDKVFKESDTADNICIPIKDWTQNLKNFNPDSLGIPPECAQAAITVLDAVLADVLTPDQSVPKDYGGSKSLGVILQENIGSF